VDGTKDEHAAEVGQLSQLAMEISNAFVDLEMLLVRDIPQLPKSAQKVLTMASLLLECL
jgi:hypothetical protein